MNRSYIDMHLAVDRYLRGTLSEEEAAEFEERLVWDQALLDDIDLAEQLRNGLRTELGKNEAASINRGGLVDKAASLFRTPALAAAASFVLAIGGTSLVMTSGIFGGGPAGVDGDLPTEILPLYATRSNDAVPVTVSEDAWTVLLLDAPPGYARYRATVSRRDETATAVWSRGDLLPTYPESLAVGMPGDLLAEGEYTLSLEGMMDASVGYEPIQSISFDVTREPDSSR